MTSPDTHSAPAAPPGRAVQAVLALSAVLALAGLGAFYYATRNAQGPQRGDTYTVVVHDTHCEPADFRVPAGLTTFDIRNASRRPLEWEILDGVMVVAERENIAPGFHSLLTVKLRPGQFAITCGLLSNPRGTLEVLPTQASEDERLRPPVQAFISPLSESKVFLALQSRALAREAQALADAIAAGDLPGAQQQWHAARQPYKRMEAVAGRFADLQARIDPQARYLPQQEADPGFIGFHRLEKILFQQQALEDAAPVAQALAADVQTLQQRLAALQQRPEDLADSALWLVQRLLEGVVEHGESPYAHSDLADLSANAQGLEKTVLLLNGLLQGAQPALAEQVRSRFAALRQALDALQADTASRTGLSAAQRTQLLARWSALAEALRSINPALGL